MSIFGEKPKPFVGIDGTIRREPVCRLDPPRSFAAVDPGKDEASVGVLVDGRVVRLPPGSKVCFPHGVDDPFVLHENGSRVPLADFVARQEWIEKLRPEQREALLDAYFRPSAWLKARYDWSNFVSKKIEESTVIMNDSNTNALTDQLNGANAELDTLRDELDQARRDLSEERQDFGELSSELKRTKEELAKALGYVETHRRERDAARAERDSAVANARIASNERVRASDVLTEVRLEMSELRARYSKVLKERDDANRKSIENAQLCLVVEELTRRIGSTHSGRFRVVFRDDTFSPFGRRHVTMKIVDHGTRGEPDANVAITVEPALKYDFKINGINVDFPAGCGVKR